MRKTSISVPEMQRLLGMKKVEAYWLVKQGRFKVILVGGKMRIMLDSFEEWYGSQFRYKKVNGPEPGQLLPASLTVPEAADILGLNPGSIYELIKNHAPFETRGRGTARAVGRNPFGERRGKTAGHTPKQRL